MCIAQEQAGQGYQEWATDLPPNIQMGTDIMGTAIAAIEEAHRKYVGVFCRLVPELLSKTEEDLQDFDAQIQAKVMAKVHKVSVPTSF